MCTINKKDISGIKHPLEWYYERVGKRIVRINGNEKCRSIPCKEARTTGLIVHSRLFAEYLFDVQEEYHYRYADMALKVIT